MDPDVLTLLRCPLTGQRLRLTSPEEAAILGLGESIALLREDSRVYYPFDDHGFPILLPGSGVEVAGRLPAPRRADGPNAHAD